MDGKEKDKDEDEDEEKDVDRDVDPRGSQNVDRDVDPRGSQEKDRVPYVRTTKLVLQKKPASDIEDTVVKKRPPSKMDTVLQKIPFAGPRLRGKQSGDLWRSILDAKPKLKRARGGQQIVPSNAEEHSEAENSEEENSEDEDGDEKTEESDEWPHEGREEESPRERDIEEESQDDHVDESQLIFPVVDDLAALTGLKTRPGLEDQLVTILKWYPEDQRYAVHLLADPDLDSFIRVRMQSLVRLKANWSNLKARASMLGLCFFLFLQ